MARYIFLDVDGVLANWRSQNMTNADRVLDGELVYHEDGADAAPPLERRCVANLAWLAGEAGGAAVILSSTWRGDAALTEFVKKALDAHALPVAGATLSVDGVEGRGGEILAFLKANAAAEAFVILDDEHARSFESCGLTRRLVRTKMASEDHLPGADGLRFDPGAGLDRAAAEAALRVLRRPLDAAERRALLR